MFQNIADKGDAFNAPTTSQEARTGTEEEKMTSGTHSDSPELIEALTEALATYAHDAWAAWMHYLFTKISRNDDGTATIPAWAVERWTRQLNMTYADLPDIEKESDRSEAARILDTLRAVLMDIKE